MRIIAMSDTHGFHKRLQVPDGDLLIHAGDFSMRAKDRDVIEFAKWFKSLPHPHKIITSGNHDAACEHRSLWASEEFAPAIYLEHGACEVIGYTIFGSSYSPAIYDPSPWFFDYQRPGPRSKGLWDQIPDHVDILVTHGPAYGLLDLVSCPERGEDPHVGDKNLLERVWKVKPKVHICGHIHEGYGSYRWSGHDTRSYNVCVCDGKYQPVNPITVIDL